MSEGIKISQIPTEITSVGTDDRLVINDNSSSGTVYIKGQNLWTNEAGTQTIKNAANGGAINLVATTGGGTPFTIGIIDPTASSAGALFVGQNTTTGLRLNVATGGNTSIICNQNDLQILNFANGSNIVFKADDTGGTQRTLLTLDPDDLGAIVNDGYIGIADGMTAPTNTTGVTKIYTDSADGDLKVKFGNGTIKTIATNP